MLTSLHQLNMFTALLLDCQHECDMLGPKTNFYLLQLSIRRYDVCSTLQLQDNVVTGRKGDVMLAAHQAAEAALRLVKPGIEVQ